MARHSSVSSDIKQCWSSYSSRRPNTSAVRQGSATAILNPLSLMHAQAKWGDLNRLTIAERI